MEKSRLDGRYLGRQCSGTVCCLITFPLINDGGGNESIIARDYEPGARIAVHRKDILNAKAYAHTLGIDLPVTDVTLRIMDWMKDKGYIDIDQAGMIKYFEEKMGTRAGRG